MGRLEFFQTGSPKKISANPARKQAFNGACFYPRLAEFNPQNKDLPAKVSAQAKRNLKNLKATIGGKAPAPPKSGRAP